MPEKSLFFYFFASSENITDFILSNSSRSKRRVRKIILP